MRIMHLVKHLGWYMVIGVVLDLDHTSFHFVDNHTISISDSVYCIVTLKVVFFSFIFLI